MPAKSTTEQHIEKVFLANKARLIRYYGRGPLSGAQINEVGRPTFKTLWRGAHAQDSVPMPLREGYYVINTSYTRGSPGVHWVGMYVSPDLTVYVYDSFARGSNRIMQHLQKRRGAGAARMLDSDRGDAEQRNSAVCGHLSLAWLLVVQSLGIRAAMLI
jgi:hypothetical protein